MEINRNEAVHTIQCFDPTHTEVLRIQADGDVIWKGRKVESDADFKAAMIDLSKALQNGMRPAPLVRLTDDDVMDAYSESSLDVNARLDDLFDFANVLQDAWIKKNGGRQ